VLVLRCVALVTALVFLAGCAVSLDGRGAASADDGTARSRGERWSTPSSEPATSPGHGGASGAPRVRAAKGGSRALAWVFTGVAIVGGASAATFAVLGTKQNSAVKNGGYATSDDVQAAIDTGQRYNDYAFGALFVGAVAAAIATGLFFYSSDPDDEGNHEQPANARP